ncbi:alpha/beta hydrolase [Thiocapsa imhoffii]|nr:alpha/beta fold hydrolase [Thiocapsa imhoffii]
MRLRWPIIVALLSLCALGVGVSQLTSGVRDVEVSRLWSADVPITLFRSKDPDTATRPLVVIAHGFAGSQQLMQAYAMTLALNGYLVATFDFPGHGRNTTPFTADFTEQELRRRLLTRALVETVEVGLRQPDADGRLALLGHSMAGDVLARLASDQAYAVTALVLISPYLAPDTSTAQLANLLFIYGAWEPELLHEQGAARVAETVDDATWTEQGDGVARPADTERRLVLVPGVEHIGVLYAELALSEALDWLNQAFQHAGGGFLDRRGSALGLLYLGLLALAWPLATWLPRLAEPPRGAGLPWRHFWPVAVVPAVLTPVLLWPAPRDVLPILLVDYLFLHFALYGVLTGLALWLTRRSRSLSGEPTRLPQSVARTRWMQLAVVTLLVSLYTTLVFAIPTDRFVTAFLPVWERLPWAAVLFFGTLLYTLADEWATRGRGAARGGYWMTKILFVCSLLGAVALNLNSLFFLLIIIPVILALFLVYGLLSTWVYNRTGTPVVAAVANALAFASAMAVTFPLVAP